MGIGEPLDIPYPSSPRLGPVPGKLLPGWPCLLPSIVVGVAPLVNLTGEAGRQDLVKNLTDCLVAELFRRCRGSLFAWVADERRWNDALPPRHSPEINYVLYGSVQRGSHGMLRVNLRISDALTADYLWAGRQEFPPEDLAVSQAEITRQISRVLHGLVLHEASR
jgi:TolB-like protein